MGRHNHEHRRQRRSPLDSFDWEYCSRPDVPHIKYFVSRRRKLIYINIDADPDAWGAVEIA